MTEQNNAFTQIICTGGETVLDYTFPLYAATYVKVVKADTDGVETMLALNDDYTVQGVGSDAGGTITLTTPALPNDIYTMLLSVPSQRATDFQQAGDFFARDLNLELDLITQRDQMWQRDFTKTIQLPNEDIADATATIVPSKDARANKLLNFDDSGRLACDIDVTSVADIDVAVKAAQDAAAIAGPARQEWTAKANKYILVPPPASGTLDTASVGDTVRVLMFDITQTPADANAGNIVFDNGYRLTWDGAVFSLQDDTNAVAQTFYDGAAWVIPSYDLGIGRKITAINAPDRTGGVWPLAAWSYQAPVQTIDMANIYDLIRNQVQELFGVFFAVTKPGTVVPPPTNISENYYNFTSNTKYAAKADLSGWDIETVITPAHGDRILISDSFLDLAVDSGRPGYSDFTLDGWVHVPQPLTTLDLALPIGMVYPSYDNVLRDGELWCDGSQWPVSVSPTLVELFDLGNIAYGSEADYQAWVAGDSLGSYPLFTFDGVNFRAPFIADGTVLGQALSASVAGDNQTPLRFKVVVSHVDAPASQAQWNAFVTAAANKMDVAPAANIIANLRKSMLELDYANIINITLRGAQTYVVPADGLLVGISSFNTPITIDGYVYRQSALGGNVYTTMSGEPIPVLKGQVVVAWFITETPYAALIPYKVQTNS